MNQGRLGWFEPRKIRARFSSGSTFPSWCRNLSSSKCLKNNAGEKTLLFNVLQTNAKVLRKINMNASTVVWCQQIVARTGIGTHIQKNPSGLIKLVIFPF